MIDLASAYRGKRVMVTGHTGFKGSWMSLFLAEMGARVFGYALQPPTTPSLFDEARVRETLAGHRIADVRDHEALAGAVKEWKPEILFHMAAQPLVRRSYREPRETYETNVMGTVNLLEAVRHATGVRVCQIITSDKCYENQEWVWPYRESEPMGGADPYSNSKGCAELVVSAYRRSYFPPDQVDRHGVSLSSVRAGNVIGGGDWAEDRIIPDCVRALTGGRPIQVRNPAAIRPWQHVIEPLAGYLTAAAAQLNAPAQLAEAWNFGPVATGHLTVRDVVETAIAAWGSGSWETPAPAGGATAPVATTGSLHEATFLKLDVTKAMSLLPWRPIHTAAEAIQHTMKWYRQRAAGGEAFDARRMCLDQINEYQQRARKVLA